MKVLIAEDDIISSRTLERMLIKCGYEVVVVSDGLEALAEFNRPDPPRIVLLDWMMPEMDGIDVCKRLRENVKEPYIYIVMVSALAQTKYIVEGIEAGADDFISKPYFPHELEVRLKAGKRIIELSDELIKTRDKLKYISNYDKLTGLLSRMAILEDLEGLISTANKDNSLGILMADIDNFEYINDHFGKAAGDLVLSRVAEVIRETVSPIDLAGRYGGDDFIILKRSCDNLDLLKFAEELRSNVESEKITFKKAKIEAKVSIGLTNINDSRLINTDKILETLYKTMLLAKKSGGNCVQFLNSDCHYPKNDFDLLDCLDETPKTQLPKAV